MNKILKYFLFVTIFTICFVTNAKAIESDDIDWNGEKISYNEETETFSMTDSFIQSQATSLSISSDEVSSRFNFTYYWSQVGDDGSDLTTAYNELQDALNYGDETTILQKKTALLTQLSTDISDESWSGDRAYSGSLIPGGLYVKWVKLSSNDTSSAFEPVYYFVLYKVESSSTTTSTSTSTTSNPDTGINPLYTVPVLLVLGSVLVFKKRRYE